MTTALLSITADKAEHKLAGRFVRFVKPDGTTFTVGRDDDGKWWDAVDGVIIGDRIRFSSDDPAVFLLWCLLSDNTVEVQGVEDTVDAWCELDEQFAR
jgi:hypothetical protein